MFQRKPHTLAAPSQERSSLMPRERKPFQEVTEVHGWMANASCHLPFLPQCLSWHLVQTGGMNGNPIFGQSTAKASSMKISHGSKPVPRPMFKATFIWMVWFLLPSGRGSFNGKRSSKWWNREHFTKHQPPSSWTHASKEGTIAGDERCWLIKKKSCNKKTVPTTPWNTKLTCLLKQP